MTPYDIVKKACIEANPDILKLEFGCMLKRFISEEDSMLYTVLERGSGLRPDRIWVSSRVFGDMLIPKQKVFASSNELSIEEIRDRYEILGREILAQDVQKILPNNWYMKWVGYKDDPRFEFVNMKDYNKKGFKNEYCVFYDKSLEWHRDNQPETIEFLAKLLGKDE